MIPYFTAIIQKEDDMFVALCPELDIASQGHSVEESKNNLKEALELFFENASESEINTRIHYELFITPLEVNVGKTAITLG